MGHGWTSDRDLGSGHAGWRASEHTFQGSAAIDDPDGKGLRNRACRALVQWLRGDLRTGRAARSLSWSARRAVLDVWRLRDRSGRAEDDQRGGCGWYESVSKGRTMRQVTA